MFLMISSLYTKNSDKVCFEKENGFSIQIQIYKKSFIFILEMFYSPRCGTTKTEKKVFLEEKSKLWSEV